MRRQGKENRVAPCFRGAHAPPLNPFPDVSDGGVANDTRGRVWSPGHSIVPTKSLSTTDP
jgi:hypothetical protein